MDAMEMGADGAKFIISFIHVLAPDKLWYFGMKKHPIDDNSKYKYTWKHFLEIHKNNFSIEHSG